jgi:hypothetical protein
VTVNIDGEQVPLAQAVARAAGSLAALALKTAVVVGVLYLLGVV